MDLLNRVFLANEDLGISYMYRVWWISRTGRECSEHYSHPMPAKQKFERLIKSGGRALYGKNEDKHVAKLFDDKGQEVGAVWKRSSDGTWAAC